MRKNKIDVISLGCSKNLVDSERLMRQFAQYGYKLEHNPGKVNGEIVVVNTCGFIQDAQQESINMILELVDAKRAGKIKKLFVMGCLAERFLAELQNELELAEVDKFYGKFNWHEMLNDLGKAYNQQIAHQRILTTPSHYAYIKISEGCNRFCAFCAIPIITGRHKSVPIDDIVNEVSHMASQGVKEFNIIAQDLSSYGTDLYGEMRLPQLVDAIANVPGVEWIRLHYAYPAQFPYGLLEVMNRHSNVCRYLDIALQHISDPVLSNMQRHINKEQTLQLIERLRHDVPGIHLRTTLMVGFPGEGEQEFQELLQFVKDVRFDRMGAFAYSQEEGTYAAKHFTDSIPHEVKQKRLEQLMELQEQIALELNEEKIGTTQRVVIDSESDEFYIGRTQYDSPEVDPEVLIAKDKKLEIGNFYDVDIVDALPYELIAKVK
ncbi:MAG: 30S ribosomal protein S12 methylthiotransferase RimO [Muribaculaceae bacterium]